MEIAKKNTTKGQETKRKVTHLEPDLVLQRDGEPMEGTKDTSKLAPMEHVHIEVAGVGGIIVILPGTVLVPKGPGPGSIHSEHNLHSLRDGLSRGVLVIALVTRLKIRNKDERNEDYENVTMKAQIIRSTYSLFVVCSSSVVCKQRDRAVPIRGVPAGGGRGRHVGWRRGSSTPSLPPTMGGGSQGDVTGRFSGHSRVIDTDF